MSDRPWSAIDQASLARARDQHVNPNKVSCCSQPRSAHCPHIMEWGRCPVPLCRLLHHGRESAPPRTPRSLAKAAKAIEEAIRNPPAMEPAPRTGRTRDGRLISSEACGCALGPLDPWESLLAVLDTRIESAITSHLDLENDTAKVDYWQGYLDAARSLRSDVVRYQSKAKEATA